jgi:hypothetical protein
MAFTLGTLLLDRLDRLGGFARSNKKEEPPVIGDRRQGHVRQGGPGLQTPIVSPRRSIVLLAATGVRRIWSDVRSFRERSGHANVGTTLSVDAAFIPKMQADAAAGIDSWSRKAVAEEGGGNCRF